MNIEHEAIYNQAKKLSNTQLKLYTQTIREAFLEAGLDKIKIDTALKQSIQKLKQVSTFDKDCRALISQAKDNAHARGKRGIDSIGRILVEYCFLRVPQTQMLWPDESKNDLNSRNEFIPGIIPRPLMRYFLVSVRGTIPELNKFEASSVLFGKENNAHEQRKEYVDELVKEFQGTDKINAHTKWNEIYSDSRFQKIALDLIGDIRRKIEQFGLERYLRILENLRQRDPDNKSINKMYRPFCIEDAKQIDNALWAAEEALAK